MLIKSLLIILTKTHHGYKVYEIPFNKIKHGICWLLNKLWCSRNLARVRDLNAKLWCAHYQLLLQPVQHGHRNLAYILQQVITTYHQQAPLLMGVGVPAQMG